MRETGGVVRSRRHLTKARKRASESRLVTERKTRLETVNILVLIRVSYW